LSDPSKKERYDQFGHAGVDPSYGGGGFSGGFGGFGSMDDISDIFSSFFGSSFGGSSRSSSANGARRGQDIQVNITISFMEACNGKKVDVNVGRMEQCPDCHGSGAAPGTSAETCSECHGTGQIKVTQRTPFGIISSAKPCPKCGGKGKVIKTQCQKCRGSGRVNVNKTISVDIPAGIDDGQTLQVRGQGHGGINGGPSGDLHIYVSVKPDPIFERDGFDIHTEVPITFAQAALGDEITVPSIDGKVNINIPEGTQSGTIFRLRGKGIKKINRSDRGDQFVRVSVEVPKNLSKKQKDLIREFDSSMSDDNYNKRKNFFDKIRNAFSSDR